MRQILFGGLVGFVVIVAMACLSLAEEDAAATEQISKQEEEDVETTEWLESWTTEEMANCASQPEPAECDAAKMYRQIQTSQAIRELSPSDRASAEAVLDLVVRIDAAVEGFVADAGIDESELSDLCLLAPQWLDQIQEAQEFLGLLNRTDMQGLEIDLHSIEALSISLIQTCRQEMLD